MQFAVKKREVTCLALCLLSVSLVSVGTLLSLGSCLLLHVGGRLMNPYLQLRPLCRALAPHILLVIVHRHLPRILK